MNTPLRPRNFFTALRFALFFTTTGAIASAQSFHDDFQRANTSSTTIGTDIGDSYIISSPVLDTNGGGTAPWQINGNKLVVSPGSISQDTIVSSAVTTRTALGVGFTASCDMSSTNSGYMGLAVNYQDKNNFYAIRVSPGSSTIQLSYIQTAVSSNTDNFNRTDTGATTNGSVIGSGYIISTPALPGNSGTASWKIAGNKLASTPGSNSNDTLVYGSLATRNSDGLSFNLRADMTTANSGAYMGLALNYQDADDFYAIRLKPGSSSIQLMCIQNVSGTVSSTLVTSKTLSHTDTFGVQTMTIATGNTYYMRVTSNSAGVFVYTVTDTATGFTVGGTLQDTSPKFSDGIGGLYSTLAASDFDNLVVAASHIATDVADSETLTTLSGGTMTVATGDDYTLTATSTASGQFEYILQDQTSSTIAQGTLSDTGSRFRNGYCGLYATLASADFHSLAVTQSDNGNIDNFDRADTGTTTSGSVIGNGYIIGTPALAGNSGTAGWEISGDTIVSTPGANVSNTLVNENTVVNSGSGHAFAVSGTLSTTNSAYMGLAVNYQDADDFYAVRILPGSSTIQLIYVQNSGGTVTSGVCASQSMLDPTGNPVTVGTGTTYTLSLYSDTAGSFDYVLTSGTSTAKGTLTDSSVRFTGGAAGFYASGAAANFDDLAITTNVVAFHDDFARTATGTTTSGGAIGPGYCITTPALSGASGTAAWQITSGGLLSVTPGSTTSSSTLVRVAAAEIPVSGEAYTVGGDVIPAGAGWAGVAINYQDANNYYAVRVQGGTTNLQLIYVQTSGGSTALHLAQGVTLPFTIYGGTDAEIVLTSSSPGVFTYTITNGSNVATGTLTDAAGRFTGGFAGYYAGTATLTSSFGPLSLVVARQKVATQYLVDPTLQAGVSDQNVYAKPVVTAGSLQWTTANGNPAWVFSEYNNVVSLYPTSPTLQGDGSYLWQVGVTAPGGTYYPLSKTLFMAPAGSSAASSYDFGFRVNSFADYDNTFRTSTQPWPTAYFGQRVAAPGGTLNRSNPTLADLKKLDLNITAAIPVQTVDHGTGYNPSIHVAHLLLFITVQNLNANSSGYSDYMWFGIQLFNDQVDPTVLTTLVDAGTGKYIYNVGVSPFLSSNIGSGGSTAYKTVSGDVLPLIKQALQHIWHNTSSLHGSQRLADYQVGSCSIGWEVPGLADVQANIKDLSLVGTW